MKTQDFKIDFFELSFLAEVCIPPVPIARGVFWEKLINNYFYEMTPDERESLFSWITKNSRFDLNNEDCAMFYARYYPDNQYKVTSIWKGKERTHDCFKWKGTYRISKTKMINEDCIINIQKKPPNHQ